MKTPLFQYNNDISNITCLNIFLDALKIEFDSFAQFYEDKLYFTVDSLESNVQTFIDTFDCAAAENVVLNTFPETVDVLKQSKDPTISINPSGTGVVWVNEKTGDSFVCTNNTPNENVWVGMKTGKLIRPVPPADKFDFFGDSSIILFAPLNGTAEDMGGLYNGNEQRIVYEDLFDEQIASSTNNGTIKFENLPITSETTDITVTSWVYWTGKNSTMPFGWDAYDIWCQDGNLGFNTFNSDLYGFNFKDYKNQWIYLSIVFKQGTLGKIFINGAEQILSQKRGTFNSAKGILSNKFSIFGVNTSTGYRNFGKIGRVRLFNRELNTLEIQTLTQAEVNMITSVGGTV